jgi:hypothetical protein
VKFLFRKSIILVDAPGQMCNRLWSAASWISYCNENNYYLIWLGFYEYIKGFKLKEKNSNIYVLYGFWPNIINMYISKLCVLACRTIYFFDSGFGYLNFLYTEKSIENFKKSKMGILVMEGWPSIKPNNSLIYGYDHISSLFQVLKPPALSWKSNSVIKIGIHVRKGDYKNFKDGMFYYEDEVYVKNVLHLISQLNLDTQNISIFIASNCDNSKNIIKNKLPFHTLTNDFGTDVDDLFALSQCQFILGPPSSFSCWAAYMGRSKLAFILNPHNLLSLTDFIGITSDDVRDECRLRVGYWWP